MLREAHISLLCLKRFDGEAERERERERGRIRSPS